jgi:two-component system sensor histidine kinase EvgS
VAHDYNNMLNIICGYSELGMAAMDPDDPLHTNFEEIFKAAERSSGITKKLLAFARKQMVIPEVIDLNLQLNRLEAEMKRQLGEDIDLSLRLGSELWPVKIDPSQLGQLLTNLCVNSRDAIGGRGRVTIETENASFNTASIASRPGFVPGDFVMLSLGDDGKGMEKKVLNSLFDPFFTTKPFGESAGLGLAVVYGIVKQNNGFFDVSSEPGKGTVFRFYFPRQKNLGELKS